MTSLCFEVALVTDVLLEEPEERDLGKHERKAYLFPL